MEKLGTKINCKKGGLVCATVYGLIGPLRPFWGYVEEQFLWRDEKPSQLFFVHTDTNHGSCD